MPVILPFKSLETDIDQLNTTSYSHTFITPEMLNKYLEQLIDETTISHVFVDESHCFKLVSFYSDFFFKKHGSSTVTNEM